MSRYRYHFEERDAYERGERASFLDRNPYDEHGSHEDRKCHEAFDAAIRDRRDEDRRREEREQEEAEQYARARRAAEDRAMEEEFYAQQYEPEPPSEPDGPEPEE